MSKKSYENLDYSDLLNLFKEEQLQKISNDLLLHALNKKKSFTKINLDLEVPASIVDLLDSISKTFSIDSKVILSKLTNLALGKLLEQVVTEAKNQYNQEDSPKKDFPLSNIEPINEISKKLDQITNIFSQLNGAKENLEKMNANNKKNP